jgi:hypothetical protein
MWIFGYLQTLSLFMPSEKLPTGALYSRFISSPMHVIVHCVSDDVHFFCKNYSGSTFFVKIFRKKIKP